MSTPISTIQQEAQKNLHDRLINNDYPGRGIVMGKNPQGDWIIAYWIMGRSVNSRNRIFLYENNVLRTQAANPDLLIDPSLTIYNAMCEQDGHFIVSNGAHTDTIVEGMKAGKSFESSLLQERHEPDAPNYTPRISGLLTPDSSSPITLSIIKKSAFGDPHSEHSFFQYTEIPNGYGYGITTYEHNGNPLPSFVGSPFTIELQGDNTEKLMIKLWKNLNEANRISLAVLQVNAETLESKMCVVNKHQ